jgi:hypothetical protein
MKMECQSSSFSVQKSAFEISLTCENEQHNGNKFPATYTELLTIPILLEEGILWYPPTSQDCIFAVAASDLVCLAS